MCRIGLDRIGIWLLSVIATLALPCLPLCIEWLRTGDMKSDTMTLTAAVLAATFIFSAEHVLNLCVYILLFVVNLLFNTVVGPTSPAGIDAWTGTLLMSVTFFHAIERFWWHVVLDRPFPDRVNFLNAAPRNAETPHE